VDETQLELKIGRLPHSQRGGAHDLVSIADVGFGVSQALPVLVALLAAEPGQIVYIEQPEIHLHPLAQRKMAVLLCRTARRGGPILVIETHSALLVREIRTMVAKGEYSAENVGLNWFQRGSEGTAKVHAAKLGEDGSYGTWPVDFDEIELESDKAYLDAVDKRMAKAAKK
jgi:predicted ATPase